MKNWFSSLVITGIVGAIFWLVYNANPLDQLWTVVVVVALVVLARIAYDFLVRMNQEGQAFDPVVFVAHVVFALLATYVLYLLGLTGAIGLGFALFASYYVVWLLAAAILGEKSVQSNTKPAVGRR